jgi:hypothetical protein
MKERYKGYDIEYIDYRGEYRITDPLAPGTIAYVDSVEEAKQGIDEQLTAKEEIYHDNGYGTTYRFTVVTGFPDSRYVIWNIGDCLDGYLPLCRIAPSEYDWQRNVDVDTLAAIDMRTQPELRQALLKAAGVGVNNLYEAEKCLNIEPDSLLAKEQRDYAIKLLPAFEMLSEKFYTPEYESEPDDEPEI